MSTSIGAGVTIRGGTSEDNNVSGRKKFRKGDRSRRIWIAREEEILAASLVELVARGWKSDNGFRSGYLTKIEDNIRAEFPKSDIKGQPHIVSKITAWKKNYTSLRGILSRSGVGFNADGDYKIDINDDQWEQVMHADKNAKGMRNKSWPFWEDWKSIFGKDRATGVGGEDIEVAAATLQTNRASGSQCNENNYLPTFEDFLPNQSPNEVEGMENQHSSSAHTEHLVSNTKSHTQKRKAPATDDALMDFLGNLHAQTNARLDVIASRIGYEFDIGKARQEVFDKLCDVDGLTLAQRYKLCSILADKPQRMEVFMGMKEHAKLGYLLMLFEESREAV
ncbi:hypothetical protein SASPL_123378 [Salvia splendens]|uniref:Myb/SANT-like domain-containing protein n=1 Tax=Salvia splendens TaxID=180675 RepID=A0A8X8XNF9_SALSN|nr:hypothetical protein SASPL_123378 [Salvia splendens]